MEAAFKLIRCQPVGFVGIVEPVGDFAVIAIVMRVSQLQSVGNQIGLLLFFQQGNFTFDLLVTHGSILAGDQSGASATL